MTDAKDDVLEVAKYFNGLTLYSPDSQMLPAAMNHVRVTLPRALSMQECIRSMADRLTTLIRERDEARRDVERLCQWREDDSDFDTWKTGCGHLWQFNTGGPKENGTKFCQYCGGALTAALTQEDA